MSIWKKPAIYTLGIMLTLAICTSAVVAAGPPLKDNACGACHKEFSKIIPKNHPDVIKDKGASCLTCHAPDPAKTEPTKFSTEVHKVHQGGKIKLECSSCHAL